MRLTHKDLEPFYLYQNFTKNQFETLPKASFLFVTYNRCPYKNFQKNPLTWAFQTLVANQLYQLDEFVVIDDSSTDYTYKNIKWLEKELNIKIIYSKNKEHRDLSYSRTIGLNLCQNNLVFMGDDDCLFSPYFLYGAILSYVELSKICKNIAVLNLNVYEKNIKPLYSINNSKIGKMFWEKPGFLHNFEYFPEKYLKNPEYLLKENNLLMPLEVDTFKGVNLTNKELISDVGNYLDLSDWKYGYSEHIELSNKIQEKGYKIFHQSDPKIYSIHLKYGEKSHDIYDRRSFKKKIAGTPYTLGNMIVLSQKTRYNTGTRSKADDFHIVEIGSFFSFYLKISKKLGIKFALRMYRIFVEKGVIFSTTPNKYISTLTERRKIWELAIKKGIEISEKQTQTHFTGLYSQIKKLIDR